MQFCSLKILPMFKVFVIKNMLWREKVKLTERMKMVKTRRAVINLESSPWHTSPCVYINACFFFFFFSSHHYADLLLFFICSGNYVQFCFLLDITAWLFFHVVMQVFIIKFMGHIIHCWVVWSFIQTLLLAISVTWCY